MAGSDDSRPKDKVPDPEDESEDFEPPEPTVKAPVVPQEAKDWKGPLGQEKKRVEESTAPLLHEVDIQGSDKQSGKKGARTEDINGRKVTYDKNNEISKVESPDGKVRTFERQGTPPNSKVVAIRDSDGTAWTSKDGKTFEKEGAAGDKISGELKVKEDGSFSFKLENKNEVEVGTDKTIKVFDANGKERQRFNPDGSRLSFDEKQRLIESQDASGRIKAYGYEGDSRLPSRMADSKEDGVWTSRDGKNWVSEKNPELKKSFEVLENGDTITRNPDKTSRIEKLNGTVVNLDSSDRPVSATDKANETTLLTLDPESGKAKELVIMGPNLKQPEVWKSEDGKNWTRYENNEPTKDTKKAEFSIDREGRLHEKTDKQEKIRLSNGWSELRDENGVRFEKSNENGSKVTKNQLGQITELTNAKGQTTKFGYDQQGRITSIEEPGGRKWTSKDGQNYSSTNPPESKAMKVQPLEQGSYIEFHEDKSRTIHSADGTRASLDAKDRITETIDINGKRRAYQYDQDSKEPARILEGPKGKETIWTAKALPESANAPEGAREWSSPGKESFTGIKKVHPDGALESIDLKGNKQAELMDGRLLKRDSLNRPTFVRTADGIETSFKYQGVLLKESSIKGKDGVTKTYDQNGRLKGIDNPDGSYLKFTESGQVSERRDKTGSVMNYTWEKNAEGKEELTGIKTSTAEWVRGKDGKSWSNIKSPGSEPWVGKILAYPNGDYATIDEKSKTATVKHLDGTRETQNAQGGIKRYDAEGKVTEMVTPLGEKRQFEYFPKGHALAGKLNAVTGPDGVRWSTENGYNWQTKDGKQWQGECTYKNGLYKEVDRHGNEKHRSVDGKHEDVDVEAMKKDMEAIEYAMNGGIGVGTDEKTIYNILENRTEAQRAMIEKLWNDKYESYYKHDFRDEFRNEMEGSDLQKAFNLLDRKDGKADYTGELKYSIMDRSHWFSNRSNSMNEKAVRETLAKMTSSEIEEADAAFRREGGSLRQTIDSSSLPQATKDAAKIYLKGADKRTDADTLKLADLALKDGNLEMFAESWAGASQKAREQFIKENGEQRMKDAFGGSYWHILGLGLTGNVTDRDLTRATDYQTFGKLSAATETRENTTWLGDNEEAIEKSLANMTDAERQLYMQGNNEYHKKTREALEAAAGIWFSGDSQKAELAKWEDMIRVKGGTVISRIAEQRGVVYNSGTETVMKALENMSKEDWARLKTDPKFKYELEDTIKTLRGYVSGQSQTEIDRALEIVEQKSQAEADTSAMNPVDKKLYETGKELVRSHGLDSSKLSADEKAAAKFYLDKAYDSAKETARRDIFSALSDNVRWYNNNEDKIYEAIANMTPAEISDYKTNRNNFRNRLNDELDKILDSGGERAVADGMLQKALKGERPAQSVLEKLELRSTYWTSDNAQVVRDIQAAFKADPTLQSRIANPKTAEDRALREKIHTAAEKAMGSGEYARFGKELLDTGKMRLDFQMQLNQGIFYPYEGLYQDAANASAQDRQALLNNPAALRQAFRGLSPAERDIATFALKQGELRPEDKLRAYVTGAGTSEQEIKDVFAKIRDRDCMREELSKRPELQGKQITDEMVSTAINAKLNQVYTDYANKYKESLSERLSYELGGEDWVQTRRLAGTEALSAPEAIMKAQCEYYDSNGTMAKVLDWAGWDGTVAMEGSANNRAQDALIKAAATGEDMPMDQARELATSLIDAVDLRVKSENSLIDAGTDAAITAATIALLIPSGGSSVSLMALSRFPTLARGAAMVAKATQGLSKAARIEAMATYLANANRLTQLSAVGLAGGTFKLGAHQGLGSRFDASCDGVSKFCEGAVDAVGNVLGARDLPFAAGFFRESGERAAQRMGKEFLEQSGKALVNAEAEATARKGMSELLQTAMAKQLDTFDQKAVQELAEQMVKPELKGALRQQAVAQITKEITQQLEKQLVLESKHMLKQVFRETLMNMEGGFVGGSASGLVRWDPNASIEQNLQQVFTSGAAGVGMAGTFTLGMKAAGSGFDAVSSRVSKMLRRADAPTAALDPANPQIAATGKSRIPQIIGEGKAGPDNTIIFRHAEGEMLQYPDGKLKITQSKSGESITLNESGNPIESTRLHKGKTVTEKYHYDSNNKLETIEMEGGRSLKRDAADGKWYREKPDGNGGVKKDLYWDKGDISVAPDGRLQYEIKANNSKILVRAADGMEEHIDRFGRSTFKNLDLTNEKARLEQIVDSRFPDAARAERFRKLSGEFESEARKRGLPDSEIAEFYLHLNRMMADDSSSPLTLAQRADLAEQTLNHAAYTTSIDQGCNNTCNVTTLEHMLYAHTPSKAAQMIADVSLTGKYVTADGVTVDLRNVRNAFHPDAEAKRSIDLQRDGSQPLIKKDGPRDHASQIAETALVNMHYAGNSVLMKGDQRIWKGEVMLDSKGNAFHSSVRHEKMGKVFDSQGNESGYQWHNSGKEYFDAKGKKIDPDLLVFGEQNGNKYVIGTLPEKSRTPLFDDAGKPLQSTEFKPGQTIKDKDGKVILQQTKPGEIVYDKPHAETPFEPGEQLRLQKPGEAPTHVKDTKGKKTDAPGLYNREIADLYEQVTGLQRKNPILLELGDNYRFRPGENVAAISSEADLHNALSMLQRAGEFPVIMAVYSNQKPFISFVDSFFVGGSGGYHVVNIQSYDPATKMVKFTNQWGSRNDHVADGGVSLATMYKGMNKPKPSVFTSIGRKLGIFSDD